MQARGATVIGAGITLGISLLLAYVLTRILLSYKYTLLILLHIQNL